MPLRPLSEKQCDGSVEISAEDLRIARELERQILEGRDLLEVERVVREVLALFLGKMLNATLLHAAQQALNTKFQALGPDFPRPGGGVRPVLKVNPDDPASLLLELEYE